MSSSEKQSHRSSPSRNSSSGSKTKRSKYEETQSNSNSSKTKSTQSFSKVKMPLPKEYQPIHTFIDDKTEMLEQMFITVQGDPLKGMLPDILKNCPINELKKMCLDQLKLMSRKQILHILSGKDPASFSPSDDSDHENAKEEDSKSGNVISSHKRAAPTSSHQEDDSAESSAKRLAKELSACSTPHSRSDGEGAGGEALYLCAPQEEIDSLIQGETPHHSSQSSAENTQPPPPSLSEISQEDKTLCSELEILELEMRARAIRSLMRAQGILSSDDEGDKSCVQIS